MSNVDKKKKQELGIFYTDPQIVNFIYDVLLIWKEKEEVETGRWESRKRHPSVIDPAVGEGIFLKVALERQFTTPKYVFGIDINEAVKKKWEEVNLLRSFGSKAELEVHFYHQNGLIPLDGQKLLRHKKGGLREFDAVVGNPPYGGIGVDFEGKLSPENMQVLESLENYEVLVRRKLGKPAQAQPNLQAALFQFQELNENKARLARPEVIRLSQSVPIEILFLERFIQLAKPGGWIAIIIPDGILANSNSHYVREFIAEKTKVEAIISLPRDAFKNVGTSAKTSILFLQKLKDQNKKQDLNYPVFLASVESLDENIFKAVSNLYKEYYNKTMKKNNLVQTINDDKGRELVIIRADKTLKEMMEERPSSRWSPGYWNPNFDYLDELLESVNAKSLLEIEGEESIIAGDHVRPSRGEKKDFSLGTGIEYYETAGFLETSYNYSKIKQCSQNAYERLQETAVKQYDILISVAGVGGVGKARSCLITHKPSEKSCTGDVFAIRLRNVRPFYFYIFLKSKIGKDQILKMKNGVGTENLNSKETLALRVPILPDIVQQHIETEFRNIVCSHDKAMEAKKNNNEAEYRKNIETAEKMLRDLIAKTEAVIRGEREDVI